MTEFRSINRRSFIAAAGAGALALTGLHSRSVRAAESGGKDPFRGLKVGLASYSTRKFTLQETLAMMKELQIQYVTLKDFHLKMDSTAEERKAVAQAVKDAGFHLMGAGVVYLKNDEAQVRNAFEYCRDAGMPVMVSAPDIDALPLIDRMVKEFDIRVAIHNHGPGDQRYPSPLDAYRLAQPFDKRIGCCIDIGHSVRIGDNEIDTIRAVKDRLHDFHIKDVTERSGHGKAIEVGRGVIDIPGVLKTLLEVGFDGHLALEYEINESNPMPGMQESFDCIRKVLAEI